LLQLDSSRIEPINAFHHICSEPNLRFRRSNSVQQFAYSRIGGEEDALPTMDADILCAYRQRLNQERPDPGSLPVINDGHGHFGEISGIGVAEAPDYADKFDFMLSFVERNKNQPKMVQSVRLCEADHFLI